MVINTEKIALQFDESAKRHGTHVSVCVFKQFFGGCRGRVYPGFSSPCMPLDAT